MHPTRFQKRSVLEEWKLTNPQGNDWNHLYRQNHEDRIAGKGCNSMNHFNLVLKFIPLPQVMKIRDAKAAVDKEWKKLETTPAWQLEKVHKERQKESPLCCNDGHMSSQKCGVRAEISEVERQSRAPWRHRKRQLWGLRSIYQQGSSASQMTAAKVMDFHCQTARL